MLFREKEPVEEFSIIRVMGCVAVAPEGGPVQPTNPSAVQSKLRL